MSKLRWPVWLGIGLGCAAAWAGPPLLTDDPDLPKAGTWEFNISHKVEKTRDEFVMAAPLFDLNYSPADNQQFNFAYFSVLSVDPSDEPNQWGIGDLSIAYKYRFLEQSQSGILAAVNPTILLPTGEESRHLGDGRVELFCPLEVGRRFFDDKPFVWSEVGFTVVPEDSRFNSFRWGVAGEWEVNKTWSLLAEIGGASFRGSHGSAFTSLGDTHMAEPNDIFFDVGFWRVINDRVSLIASAGRSFHDESHGTPVLQSFVGFQITWGGKTADE